MASVITSVVPSLGPSTGGTAVTLVGTGFVVGSTITFGGRLALSPVRVDAQHWTCLTPPHTPGAVTVQITEPV